MSTLYTYYELNSNVQNVFSLKRSNIWWYIWVWIAVCYDLTNIRYPRPNESSVRSGRLSIFQTFPCPMRKNNFEMKYFSILIKIFFFSFFFTRSYILTSIGIMLTRYESQLMKNVWNDLEAITGWFIATNTLGNVCSYVALFFEVFRWM